MNEEDQYMERALDILHDALKKLKLIAELLDILYDALKRLKLIAELLDILYDALKRFLAQLIATLESRQINPSLPGTRFDSGRVVN